MSGFRPGWLPSLMVLLLLPGLLALGVWQLQRGEEKRALLNSFEARRQAEPISLEQLEPMRDPAYRRVQLRGHFDADQHFGFEAASWYWHFVDVVWLGLFIFVYVL